MEAYVEQSAIRGSRFVMDNPQEAVQILLKRVPSLDPEIAKQAVADLNRDKVWGINGGVDRDVTDFTIKFTLDSKMVPTPVTYEQVVDPSLVNSALARTGKR
jgi:ABC-type nitrate/sulfonate/bicarbonate transport system substrate-binding protein